MKYKNGDDVKKGDYVRIVKCCYPTPSNQLLGKVSKVCDLYESVGMVRLERWEVNVGLSFLEKTNDLNDIEMELNENTIFILRD